MGGGVQMKISDIVAVYVFYPRERNGKYNFRASYFFFSTVIRRRVYCSLYPLACVSARHHRTSNLDGSRLYN